jgi:hypothetical protein
MNWWEIVLCVIGGLGALYLAFAVVVAFILKSIFDGWL